MFFFARHHGHGQNSGDGAQASVESEFADKQKSAEIGDAQRAVRAENSKSDGQIEARAFFFEIGGREVDGDEGRRNQIAGVLDCGANAVAAFADSGIGQTDRVKVVLVAYNAAIVHFDID